MADYIDKEEKILNNNCQYHQLKCEINKYKIKRDKCNLALPIIS